jgi:hypothetical protein
VARRRRPKGKSLGAGLLKGALAFAAGALGTTLVMRRKGEGASKEKQSALDYLSRATPDRWARPGMEVTFRAELMPGRSRTERTFRVASVLPSGRVTLEGVAGEHAETEFVATR